TGWRTGLTLEGSGGPAHDSSAGRRRFNPAHLRGHAFRRGRQPFRSEAHSRQAGGPHPAPADVRAAAWRPGTGPKARSEKVDRSTTPPRSHPRGRPPRGEVEGADDADPAALAVARELRRGGAVHPRAAALRAPPAPAA